MRFFLPSELYLTIYFFLSVFENFKIYLKPCTQEEGIEFLSFIDVMYEFFLNLCMKQNLSFVTFC